MEDGLQQKKQAVVREALYDAAIDLFAEKGFDETTVEEVAQAAGVSRRTFFRYFASKDDLLAHSVIDYVRVLVKGVESCSAELSSFEVLTETVLSTARFTETLAARTRQVVKISSVSASARQAYQSRMMDVEDSLARAFAAHFHEDSPYATRPRLLASITLSVMNNTIVSWFRGQHKDLTTAAEHVLGQLRFVLDEAPAGTKGQAAKSKAPAKRSVKA